MPKPNGTSRYTASGGTRWRVHYFDDDGARRSIAGYTDEKTAKAALHMISVRMIEEATNLRTLSRRAPRPKTLDPADKPVQALPEDPTIEQYSTHWLASSPHYSPTTIAGYRRQFTNHILPAIGKHRVTEVQPGMLAQMYQRLMRSGRIKTSANTRPCRSGPRRLGRSPP